MSSMSSLPGEGHQELALVLRAVTHRCSDSATSPMAFIAFTESREVRTPRDIADAPLSQQTRTTSTRRRDRTGVHPDG